MGQYLSSLACKEVPWHQSKKDREKYLVPMNAINMSKSYVHEPVRRSRKYPQKSKVKEKIVFVFINLIS
jgi:hypothetical protein